MIERAMTRQDVGWSRCGSGLVGYDPPDDGPCAACGEPLTPETVMTITGRDLDPPDRLPEVIVFFRLHCACNDHGAEMKRLAFEALQIGRDIARGMLS